MIIGIEGTGSQDWGNADLTRTFVRRVLHQTAIRPASYFIGPNMRGSDGPQIVEGAAQALKSGYHNKPIVMTGYSRGAAYCMYIAEQAQSWGAVIDLMILFDAVARQKEFTVPDKVPKNVRRCIHAYRNPAAGSRYFFQNVGLTPEDPHATAFAKKMFFGSHGSLGGTSYNAAEEESGNSFGNAVATVDDRQLLNIPRQPVTGQAADDACAAAVATWVWPKLEDAGVVPKGTNCFGLAPNFNGSRSPGTRNMIR